VQLLKKVGSVFSVSTAGGILALLKASVTVGFAVVLTGTSAFIFLKKGLMKFAQLMAGCDKCHLFTFWKRKETESVTD